MIQFVYDTVYEQKGYFAGVLAKSIVANLVVLTKHITYFQFVKPGNILLVAIPTEF